MDREINLDSILALEKQIEEHEGHERVIIQLKRTRNSLLNMSTLLPPEILGRVFCWDVIRDGDFGGFSKGSYNFLLVCHHWFEVASHTPELWTSWGNSIHDWTHRHAHYRTAPLDLVLNGTTSRKLDGRLRDALQDRAAVDAIRQVHLCSDQVRLLNSIISSIVVEGEGTQSNSMESLIIMNGSRKFVDISAFFSRHRLPKLQCLCLYWCRISSWDLLKLQTSALTTLDLDARELSPTPTLPQLLSILASNPLLQDLGLCTSPVPHAVDDGGSSPRVSLRHLKKLHFTSKFFHAFWLLDRLDLPDKTDRLSLSLYELTPLDLSQTLRPYLGDRVRRRGGFPGGGLGLSAKHGPTAFCLCTGDVHKGDDLDEVDWFVEVLVTTNVQLEDEEANGLYLNLVSRIPWDQIISLETTLPILRSEQLCIEPHDLTYLHLVEVDLSTWFMEPDIREPHTFQELLPRLEHIIIIKPALSGDDWSPLTNFLSRRAAVGNRISSLRLSGHPRMDGDVVENIKRVVDVFEDEGGDRGVTVSR